MTPFQKQNQNLTKRKCYIANIDKLPPSLPSVELEKLVIQLKTAIKEERNNIRNKIVEAHLKIGMYIAARYSLRCPNELDDIVSVMELALVKAVYRARNRLKDNNITPYIIARIHGAIRDYIKNPKLYGMSGRTLDYYIEKGDQRGDNPPYQIQEEINNFTTKENDEELFLIKELLDKSSHGYIEKRIIELRTEGYTYGEIGPMVGYCKARVQIIVSNIEDKFNTLYGA